MRQEFEKLQQRHYQNYVIVLSEIYLPDIYFNLYIFSNTHNDIFQVSDNFRGRKRAN